MINPPKTLRKCEQKSWDDIFRLSSKLAGRISRDFQPDIVVGIARGGWVPARNLCDLLDVNDLASIKIEHWGKVARPTGRAEIKYGLNINLRGKDVLVVDDITDTGESVKAALAYVRQKKPSSLRSTTLLHIKGCPFVPDYYGELVKGWKWIIFPWTVTEDSERFVKELLGSNHSLSSAEISKAFRGFYNLSLSRKEMERMLLEFSRRGVIKKVRAGWVKQRK